MFCRCNFHKFFKEDLNFFQAKKKKKNCNRARQAHRFSKRKTTDGKLTASTTSSPWQAQQMVANPISTDSPKKKKRT